MKKLLALLLTLTMVTGLFSGVTASAEDVFAQGKHQNLSWKVGVDYVLTISGDGEMKESNSFPWANYTSKIKSIVIEDGVTSIAIKAFYDLYNAKSITIGKNVKSIGRNAFTGCDNIESVTVSNNNYFHSVDNCIITNWGSELVFGCKKSIIPDYVGKICENAFDGQRYLESIVIPDTVTVIDWYAFQNCTHLTDITLGNDIERINREAFKGCTNLTNVYYTGTKEEWDELYIGIYNEPLTDATIHYNYLYNLTWAIDADGVLTISGEGDMKKCKNFPWDNYISEIKAVVIEDGVTSIAADAFGGLCYAESITIGKNVEHIGANAFAGCNNVESITVSNDNPYFHSDRNCIIDNGNTLIIGCKESIIPDYVKAIGSYAFSHCETLTNIEIPYGVKSIGMNAFDSCYGLTDIVIPDTVTFINVCAFQNCTSLNSVALGNGIPEIAFGTFNNCPNITDIYYTGTEEEWEQIKIAYNEVLTNATVHYNYVVPGQPIHGKFDNLDWIIYPDGTLIISGEGDMKYSFTYPWEDYPFDIKAIVIEDGVTSIAEKAFYFTCYNAESITIGKDVESIGQEAFSECYNIESVTVSKDNPYFHVDSNCIIDNENTLIFGCKNSIIPDYVEMIGYAAFYGQKFLTSIVIPDSVTVIDEFAFCDCIALDDVTFGKNVKEIGGIAFFGCDKLNNIIIPEGLETIEWQAFDKCTSLTNIIIPESVTFIGDYAFRDCTSLTDVYYTGTEEEWKQIKINDYNECLTNATIHYNYVEPNTYYNLTWIINSNGTLIIGGEGDMEYSFRYPWGYYESDIKAILIEDRVTSIAEEAFYRGCHYVESITIGKDIKNISDSAFLRCSNAESVTVSKDNPYFHDDSNCIIDNENTLIFGCKGSIIPDYIEKIGSAAFYGMKTITSIVIPDNVTVIGDNAFCDCTALTDVVVGKNVKEIEKCAFAYATNLTNITLPESLEKIEYTAFDECPSLTNVYYTGSKEEWQKIDIDNFNYCLTNATIHYNYSPSTTVTATVSGNVKNYGNGATIELLKDGTVIDTKTVAGKTGEYTFEEVEEGTYTVKVSASKHATREYKVTVAGEDVTQDVEIWLYGDVTKDGVVNNSDVMQINRKNNNMNSVFSQAADSDYRLKVANITAITGTDAFVNNSDVIQINRKINNMSSMFDRLA